MKDFSVHIPTQIFFGSAQGSAFGESLKALGKKALVVSGKGSVKRLGYLDTVLGLLKSNGIESAVFEGIEPNPVAGTIEKCMNEHQAFSPDFILAVGGGSVMDSAKAIAGLFHAGAVDIWPYVAGEAKAGALEGALPIACVPTTAATASEVTPFSVISNPEVNGKSHLGHEFFKPQAAWINPAFTVEIPRRTTQDGAADILSHVFENYLLGGEHSPLTDRYCESIMKTVIETLPQLLENPKDEGLRGTLLWCSTLALNGMQGAGRVPSLFPLHSLEHALSGFQHELAHGRGLASLFPAYFRWLWENDRGRERLTRLNFALFGGNPDDAEGGLAFITNFEQWLKDNELYQSLAQLGFDSADYPAIAKEVMRVHAPEGVLDVLGEFTAEDIVSIFEATARQGE